MDRRQDKRDGFLGTLGSIYNTIEGLQHGGLIERIRHAQTAFGSGWRGLRHPSFEEGLIGPGSIPGPKFTPLAIEKGFVLHEAEDFAEQLPFYLLPEIEKKVQKAIKPFTHWKLATAVGLLGLYAVKPLSLFSGRDDEANTIEGMRHGGLSQQLRRKNTPFGSGWDPMRALAKEAGMSLEKFVLQPHMKLAMASGDVVRELGKGSFGIAHLMESTVNIAGKEHPFQYVRKTVFDTERLETFHEARTQRKLQDMNAPSVYGLSGNQMYMEHFSGVSALKHMISGKQLPESFVKDLEKFVPEMHKRGIAHRDMARDFNKTINKMGRSGEIVPHNVILTPEGRAGVIDYGQSSSSGLLNESQKTLHQMYVGEKYSTNAELDMSLVKSLRRNRGKLSFSAIQDLKEYRIAGASTPTRSAHPSGKSLQAKIRTNNQATATQRTAKNMFTIGRKSKSTFRSGRKV